jgi:hypothetical protein
VAAEAAAVLLVFKQDMDDDSDSDSDSDGCVDPEDERRCKARVLLPSPVT